MSSPTITLYFDIVSPFSYIAFNVLKKSPVFSQCDIQYVPVSLRDLFMTCQNQGPIAVKNKIQWVQKERLYWSRKFNIPITEPLPSGFPFATYDLQSILCVVAQESPEHLASIIDKCFHTVWVEANSEVAKPDGYLPVIEEVLGADKAKEIANIASQLDTRTMLDANTQKVFSSGAFGLPWMECDLDGNKEGFWGVDHLGCVADFLQLDTSLDNSFKVLL